MSTPQGHGRPAGGIRQRASRIVRWGVVLSGCALLAPAGMQAQQAPRPPATLPQQQLQQPAAGGQYNYQPAPAAQLPMGYQQQYQQQQQPMYRYAPQSRTAAPNRYVAPGATVQAGGAWTQTPVIQQVQNTADSARAVHQLIEAMPTTQEDMELIERRSQLMITKANIVRLAIADQGIMDIVQYSPREISLIGLARGTTTLTMWFEGHETPLIYLVKVIRDPNLDDQRRIDYGKLERKLAVLFPNSKVYLIPMSFKIVVRGQARDQEEAANILNIIRGEVINQEGTLFGNGAGAGGGAFGAGYAGGYGGGGYGAGGAGDPYFNQVGGGLGFGGLYAGFIVNELRVPGEYLINLRWRVAELNRSQARALGVDLNILFANGRQLLQSTMGAAAAGANLAGVFENGEIGVFVNWLATNGTATILTEPNVTVLSGRPARFLSGGEFAVPTVVGISGAAGQTTTFRGFGTSVLVTPTVVDRDLIRLSTVAEFSQVNNNNSVNNIPGLDTRRVETTVEMREGQTLMLGGLLSHTKVTEVSRIPYLGDIPKIGPLLFSNKKSSMDETELLILVTPEIVRPMDAHEVPPVPGFETTYPTDHEFWKYNMTEGMPDTGYYQVPPYGSGAIGTNVGYQHFNPGPANSLYSPVPTREGGFSAPGAPNGPTPLPAAPPTEVMPNFGTQNQTPPNGQPLNGQPLNGQQPNVSPQMTGPRTAPPQGPAQPAGAIRPAGWSAPRPPAASPQAMVPMNQSAPSQGNPGSASRNRRDQQQSSRY